MPKNQPLDATWPPDWGHKYPTVSIQRSTWGVKWAFIINILSHSSYIRYIRHSLQKATGLCHPELRRLLLQAPNNEDILSRSSPHWMTHHHSSGNVAHQKPPLTAISEAEMTQGLHQPKYTRLAQAKQMGVSENWVSTPQIVIFIKRKYIYI